MKEKRYVLFMIGFFLLFWSGCSSQGVSEEEGRTLGTEEVSEKEHRIISTTVAITEIMDALELDLIGIPTSEKTLPARYKNASQVGFVKNPDLEMIKWLQPTEVFSVSTLQLDLAPVFESAGIEATFLNLDSLEKMQQSILMVGEKYDRTQQAHNVVQTIDEKLAAITKEIASREKPTVLILLGIPGSYLVATENSYIGDLVRLCGGVNVVQGEAVEYVASNTEYLQQANPDIILRAAHGMPEEVVEMFDEEFKTNNIWKHFNAVKNNRVYDLEERIFGTTGNLAVEEALDELMKLLYE